MADIFLSGLFNSISVITSEVNMTKEIILNVLQRTW